jgi:hypothetical protein
VPVINVDLSKNRTDVTLARRLSENSEICFIGDTKKGAFDLPDHLAKQLVALTGNPNGRSNSDVVLPWINAYDVVQHSRHN